jgi:hypothetical protein
MLERKYEERAAVEISMDITSQETLNATQVIYIQYGIFFIDK